MRKKVLWFIGILLLAAASGCAKAETAEQEEEKENTTVQVIEKHAATEDEYVLRDKKSVYEDDDETSVVTMYLTVRKGNSSENTNHTWAEVNEYSRYYYEERNIDRYAVEGILQVGDENGPVEGEFGYGSNVPNVTVQIRGQTSTNREQKNYKIKIKDSQGEWRGQTTLALNKHVGDGFRFRNKLAYDLMKEIPQMMSCRTQFVHLYVKDETEGKADAFEDYGLYTQVEQINKTYLKNHGLDNNGHLYKINQFEFLEYEDLKLETDPEYDQKTFEKIMESKGDSDHTKLLEMVQAVNDLGTPIEDTLNKYFDVENLVYWAAFHLLMGNYDTIGRNFYLYSPLNLDKFYILSWDNDSALRGMEFDATGYSEGDSWESGISRYWSTVLFQRMFMREEYRKELDEAVEDLRTNYLTADKIQKMAESYSNVVEPFAYRMPDLMYEPYTKEEYNSYLGKIGQEIERNFNAYKESLNKPMPFFIGLPQRAGDRLKINWDIAYDFDNEDITYTIEVATDPDMTNVIAKADGHKLPEIEIPMPAAGQYFVRVRATNTSGYTQEAFDYYSKRDDQGKVYGVKCFYILEDGSIQEYTITEGE